MAHGRPKRPFALPLAPGALEALRGPDEPVPLPAPATPVEPPSAERLRSLHDFLRQVPECRQRRGLRHSLATMLTLAAARGASVRSAPSPGSSTGSRAAPPRRPAA